MAKVDFDTVVEAVRYGDDGKIQWVRVYKRIGNAFSDRLIWSRAELVERLKMGGKVYAGKRVPLLAGTFDVSEPVRLLQRNGDEVLVTGGIQSEKDNLKSVPLI